MNNQKKITTYNFKELFDILNELSFELNYVVEEISEKDLKNNNFDLVISKKEIPNLKNQLTLTETPVSIFKLLEKINIYLLKINFQSQSELKIGKYKINLNSREMIFDNIKLKLTEKEIEIIIFLAKFDKPINVTKLQNEVWNYQQNLETHTVETHIYRLRKKIFDKFKDNNFIISKKDGYSIS